MFLSDWLVLSSETKENEACEITNTFLSLH